MNLAFYSGSRVILCVDLFLQPTAATAQERQTLNQSICLGLTEVIASPRPSDMLPGEIGILKSPLLTGYQAHTAWRGPAIPPGFSDSGLRLSQMAGHSPGTELDYLFPSQRKQSPLYGEMEQERQGSSVSRFLTFCIHPRLSLKASCYASDLSKFLHPYPLPTFIC